MSERETLGNGGVLEELKSLFDLSGAMTANAMKLMDQSNKLAEDVGRIAERCGISIDDLHD
jgi:hypothetical protein